MLHDMGVMTLYPGEGTTPRLRRIDHRPPLDGASHILTLENGDHLTVDVRADLAYLQRLQAELTVYLAIEEAREESERRTVEGAEPVLAVA